MTNRKLTLRPISPDFQNWIGESQNGDSIIEIKFILSSTPNKSSYQVFQKNILVSSQNFTLTAWIESEICKLLAQIVKQGLGAVELTIEGFK